MSAGGLRHDWRDIREYDGLHMTSCTTCRVGADADSRQELEAELDRLEAERECFPLLSGLIACGAREVRP